MEGSIVQYMNEWIGCSRTGIRDQIVVCKLQRDSDLTPVISGRKDSFPSVFHKAFHSDCHLLSGCLGFSPRKQTIF